MRKVSRLILTTVIRDLTARRWEAPKRFECCLGRRPSSHRVETHRSRCRRQGFGRALWKCPPVRGAPRKGRRRSNFGRSWSGVSDLFRTQVVYLVAPLARLLAMVHRVCPSSGHNHPKSALPYSTETSFVTHLL